jgi:hypothetical protein
VSAGVFIELLKSERAVGNGGAPSAHSPQLRERNEGQRTARSKHTGSIHVRGILSSGMLRMVPRRASMASQPTGCTVLGAHSCDTCHTRRNVGRSQYGHGWQLETCCPSFTSLARLFQHPKGAGGPLLARNTASPGVGRDRFWSPPSSTCSSTTNGVMPKASLVDLDFAGAADYSVVAMS